MQQKWCLPQLSICNLNQRKNKHIKFTLSLEIKMNGFYFCVDCWICWLYNPSLMFYKCSVLNIILQLTQLNVYHIKKIYHNSKEKKSLNILFEWRGLHYHILVWGLKIICTFFFNKELGNFLCKKNNFHLFFTILTIFSQNQVLVGFLSYDEICSKK